MGGKNTGSVIDKLTEAQLDEFREAFNSFDKVRARRRKNGWAHIVHPFFFSTLGARLAPEIRAARLRPHVAAPTSPSIAPLEISRRMAAAASTPRS